jgi:hypothetical protein
MKKYRIGKTLKFIIITNKVVKSIGTSPIPILPVFFEYINNNAPKIENKTIIKTFKNNNEYDNIIAKNKKLA